MFLFLDLCATNASSPLTWRGCSILSENPWHTSWTCLSVSCDATVFQLHVCQVGWILSIYCSYPTCSDLFRLDVVFSSTIGYCQDFRMHIVHVRHFVFAAKLNLDNVNKKIIVNFFYTYCIRYNVVSVSTITAIGVCGVRWPVTTNLTEW